jgi:RNA polymerase sigma-70 factor (sigma-E family)
MRAELEREYVEYFEARMPYLRRLAVHLCGDFHRADDIVQNAATSLYRGWAKARTAQDLDAYVRRTVINTFLRERRLRWSRVALIAHPPEQAAAEPPADERLMIRTALRRLPIRQQAVLVLRFLCDLPVAEVADLLGCAEGTVKSQTSDGLKALRRYLSTGPLDLKGARRTC